METYWDATTDEHIIRYQQEQDPVKREEIFTKYLYAPFLKMNECILRRYNNTSYIHESQDTILKEMLHHTVTQISTFKSAKGKGFGYFSTISKRKMLGMNLKGYNESLRCGISLNQIPEHAADRILEDHEEMHGSRIENIDPEFYAELLRFWEVNAERYFILNLAPKVVPMLKYIYSGNFLHKADVVNKMRLEFGVGLVTMRTYLRCLAKLNGVLRAHWLEHGSLDHDIDKIRRRLGRAYNEVAKNRSRVSIGMTCRKKAG